MSGWSPEQVKDACAAWRRSEEKRFPRPGDLLAVLKRLDTTTTLGGPKPEPWRTLTDEQFATLPLRDKARYHEIAASHVMDGWRSTLAPRQVDDEWRRRDRLRRNHWEEGARLRRLLASLELA